MTVFFEREVTFLEFILLAFILSSDFSKFALRFAAFSHRAISLILEPLMIELSAEVLCKEA